MERSKIDSILSKMEKPASQMAKVETVRAAVPKPRKQLHIDDLDDDDEGEQDEYIPVGIDGLLHASEKLLAVNRGLDKPDERDSLIFKRFMTTDRLLAERISMDADRVRGKVMPAIAKQRSLRSLHPFMFDHYMEGFLLGNPLSTPLEEINPLHLVEQSRRVTQMGPGGIGSDNAVTEDMQCHDELTEVFTSAGWKFWPQVQLGDKLACRVNGVMEFHVPSKLTATPYKGIMYGVKSRSVNFLVTPNHRFFTSSSARTEKWIWETADTHFAKNRVYLATSAPYQGSIPDITFTLPAVEKKAQGMELFVPPPIDMGDWCEFMGWYLSEGCAYSGEINNKNTITITQCNIANPAKCDRIAKLLERMPFNFNRNGNNYIAKSRVLFEYLNQFGKAAVKYVPDFIFEVKPEYRRRFLDSFLLGDGNVNPAGSEIYASSSCALIDGIERIILSLGYSSSRLKPFSAKNRAGAHSSWMYRTAILSTSIKEIKSSNHYTQEFEGMVYCATVPGSLLLTRRGGAAFWSGNSIHPSQFGFISGLEGPESEKAGIDARFAWGTKIGSNGKLYQLFKDRPTGKMRWMSPGDLDGKVLGLPQ